MISTFIQAIDDSLVLGKFGEDRLRLFDENDNFNELLQCLVIKIGKRQNDEEAQEHVIETLEDLARAVFGKKYSARGLDHIFAMCEEFILPVQTCLVANCQIFAAWSRSNRLSGQVKGLEIFLCALRSIKSGFFIWY